MIGHEVRCCNYCQHSIVVGQRWVREKVYDPRLLARDAAFRHFHAEPFEGQTLSCWEKCLLEREIARTAVIGGNGGTLRGARRAA